MARRIKAGMKGVASLVAGGLLSYAIFTALQAQQQDIFDAPPPDFTAPEITDTAALQGPRQPIFYRHDLHVGQYKMDCRYCHYAVESSASPGLPPLSSCYGCHAIAGAGKPEVTKITEAFSTQTPVEWVEVHKLPPFVQFPHSRHVNANPPVRCQECHGPIETTVQVYQYKPMKMGWCLDCHKERNVTTDCTACHY